MLSLDNFEQTVTLNQPLCQQQMRACRPNFIYYPTTFLLTFSVVHLVLSFFITGISFGWHQVMFRYDNVCKEGELCNISFNVAYKLKKPVYIYYQLDEYYQSHFRFRQSFNYYQLHGKNQTNLQSCHPRITYPGNNTQLAPCGLRAYYMFRDTFDIPNMTPMNTTLSWAHEKGNLYKNLSNAYTSEQRWMREIEPDEILSDRFEIWNRISPSPKVRKLYSVYNQSINEGNHTVQIKMLTPIKEYGKTRHFVLISQSKSGGRNFTLIGINCLICFVYVVAALASSIIQYRLRKDPARTLRRDSGFI
ncbi:hypothetical protein TVAG_280020 [Trichomonas vaginalis G3]|uniref:Uncharacterized protein n=1 Tax=Trichomonas vaginalis (strain ATCC PRA-98 / G3) TaxID=412133 RepID=A2FBL5_TRIV3|nr:aminophospholipid transmembrane transporter protein [Trichomonas vaginalis G3]EAX97701.1 hypothetical protein TVAG_280020 [Trichomonas vaginalis G3]KAI5497068.1 aminophospholipid transmembrane transporter protein [Trichomonas vaginalis G3]|eukprot:XP_001310631.1 hypothetical protein [Trichomonas vaginalis G3]